MSVSTYLDKLILVHGLGAVRVVLGQPRIPQARERPLEIRFLQEGQQPQRPYKQRAKSLRVYLRIITL